jgi:hypothetical protein
MPTPRAAKAGGDLSIAVVLDLVVGGGGDAG